MFRRLASGIKAYGLPDLQMIVFKTDFKMKNEMKEHSQIRHQFCEHPCVYLFFQVSIQFLVIAGFANTYGIVYKWRSFFYIEISRCLFYEPHIQILITFSTSSQVIPVQLDKYEGKMLFWVNSVYFFICITILIDSNIITKL